MLMGLIVILVIAAVAYFHYVQGFFSATLSAMFAIVAAVVAFGLHEWIVSSFVAAYVPDLGSALVLVVVFALVYIILRVIFDKYVPGNVAFPLMIDRIGGALAGVVAGIFAAGVLVIAAQTLPFGPAIGGYSRFAVSADPVEAKVKGASGDATVNQALVAESLGPSDEKHLMVPADDIVVNTASRLSNGALAGPVAVSAVHPSFLNELFFQRLGIQPAAKHVALNVGSHESVRVSALFSPLPSNPLAQADAEVPQIPNRQKPDALYKVDPSSILLIVRATVGGDAADKDNKVRLSPASVRLVVKGMNITPIGTLDMTIATQLRRNRPDDFIVMDTGGTIDLAFQVPKDSDPLPLAEAKNPNGPLKVAPGIFIEIKRFGAFDLSGMSVKRELPPLLGDKAGAVLRKKDLPQSTRAVRNVPTPAPSSAEPTPTEAGPFDYGSKKISNDLPAPVNISAHEGDDGEASFTSGTATLKAKKALKLEVKPAVSKEQLGRGDYRVTQLSTEEGQKVVQIIGTPSAKEGANRWEWADKLGQYELVDNGGKSYKAHGAWAAVKSGPSFEDRVAAKYDAEADLPKFEHPEDTPTDVSIFFIIPESALPQSLKFNGKVIASVN